MAAQSIRQPGMGVTFESWLPQGANSLSKMRRHLDIGSKAVLEDCASHGALVVSNCFDKPATFLLV
jgi:hypothetical protein